MTQRRFCLIFPKGKIEAPYIFDSLESTLYRSLSSLEIVTKLSHILPTKEFQTLHINSSNSLKGRIPTLYL